MGRSAFATCLVALYACGPSSSPEGAPADGWATALDTIMKTHADTYSFRFVSDDASQYRYTLAMHGTSSQSAACARYGAAAADVGDYWFIEVTVNGSAVGQYRVVVPMAPDDVGGTAYVSLLHRKNGELVESYDALSGSLSMDVVSDLMSYRSRAPIRGSLSAEFPLHALRQVQCDGSVNGDGSGFQNHCTCSDASGSQSTCGQAPMGASCCHDLSSSRRW